MKQKIKKLIPIIYIIITLGSLIFSGIIWNKYNNVKNIPIELETCQNKLEKQEGDIVRLENIKIDLEEQKTDLIKQIENLSKKK